MIIYKIKPIFDLLFSFLKDKNVINKIALLNKLFSFSSNNKNTNMKKKPKVILEASSRFNVLDDRDLCMSSNALIITSSNKNALFVLKSNYYYNDLVLQFAFKSKFKHENEAKLRL